MKCESDLAVQNAPWPTLLVEAAGFRCKEANPPAIKLFDKAFEGEQPPLSTIWAPDNSATADQFLLAWDAHPKPAQTLIFRNGTGQSFPCLTLICSFSRNGARFFLLQLIPETELPPTKSAPNGEQVTLHKQKLECALQLARTVALDFNNALTSILGHTSHILAKIEPGNPWRPLLLEVEKSAAKAAEIANDLGTFSQAEKEARTQAVGNLNQLLQRTVESLKQSVTSPSLEWKYHLERRLFAVKFDEAKLQQAILKILENCIESIRDQGRITLHSRNLELTQPTQDRNVQLPAGAYACVEIVDTGEGIPAEVLPRVFEPFFTTKKNPHRGLGLVWVYGVVTNHGGGVAISSDPGSGTSVRLYLPAEKHHVREDAVGPDADLRGTETVLMVDDEDLLLTMGQYILSAYGYRVLTANSGSRALQMMGGDRPPVDLLITDLVMPGMSGRELAEQVHRISPATRILSTSGYVWNSHKESDGTYLQKPFTAQELLLRVRQVLGNSST